MLVFGLWVLGAGGLGRPDEGQGGQEVLVKAKKRPVSRKAHQGPVKLQIPSHLLEVVLWGGLVYGLEKPLEAPKPLWGGPEGRLLSRLPLQKGPDGVHLLHLLRGEDPYPSPLTGHQLHKTLLRQAHEGLSHGGTACPKGLGQRHLRKPRPRRIGPGKQEGLHVIVDRFPKPLGPGETRHPVYRIPHQTTPGVGPRA